MSCLFRVGYLHFPPTLSAPFLCFFCLCKSSSDESTKYSLILLISLLKRVYFISFRTSFFLPSSLFIFHLHSFPTSAIDHNCNFHRVIFIPLYNIVEANGRRMKDKIVRRDCSREHLTTHVFQEESVNAKNGFFQDTYEEKMR